MHWIVAGFCMFGFSVPAYLLIRRATLSGMSHSVQNMAAFVVPLLVFIVLAVLSRTPIAVDGFLLFILVFSAVFFSYFGAKLSLLGM